MNNSIGCVFAIVLAFECAIANAGIGLPQLDGANKFGLRSFAYCRAKVTNNLLRAESIGFDLQLRLVAPVFFAGSATGVEFKYRAEGTGKGQGQLYYGVGGEPWSDSRMWKLPQLDADGNWHIARVGIKDLANPDDWRQAGVVSRFRFDPVQTPGGWLEVEYIRFVNDSEMTPCGDSSCAKKHLDLDADAWPSVNPEFWQTATVKNIATKPLVTCRGGVAVPCVAQAGDVVHLSYDYVGPQPTFPLDLELQIVSGSSLRVEDRLTLDKSSLIAFDDRHWRLSFDYRLPICPSSFKGAVRIFSPAIACVGGELPDASLKFIQGAFVKGFEKPVESGVARGDGEAHFTVNGKPTYFLWGAVKRRSRPDGRWHHSSAPLNVVTVYNEVSEWWPRGEEFDPACFDKMAENYTRENPDAYFMWDLTIYPPSDWYAENPGEMVLDQEGRQVDDSGRAAFSLASDKALSAMERAMERAMRYLESSPYANKIIGYRINSGHTIEWLGWDPPRDRKTALDFSPIMKKAFKDWATVHYPELNDRSIPTREERFQVNERDCVWDRRANLKVIAYHDFMSTVVADDIIRLCSCAKKMVGKKLIGTYYGYVMTLAESGCAQHRSHFSLNRLLKAKCVDYLMSPQAYSVRRLGDPVADMKPFATLARNGVVAVIEDDTRTHNSTWISYSNQWQTPTEELTLGVIRRNLGYSLCRCQPSYTYSLCAGTEFDFPKFAADASAIRNAGDFALKTKIGRHAEIVYAVSEETIKSMPCLDLKGMSIGERLQYYEKDGSVKKAMMYAAPFSGSNFIYNYIRLGRVGAPVDYALLEDLADDPGDYKLYIFPNAYYVSDKFRDAVVKIRKRGASILWVGPAGYMTKNGNDIAAMNELTGFEFEKLPEVTVGPRFAPKNADEVLERDENGSTMRAIKRVDGAMVVYSADENLDMDFLCDLVRRAGVFRYSDSMDPIEANDGFVVIHARFAGTKIIRLPHGSDVYDVFEGSCIAQGVKAFTVDMPLHSTRVFCIVSKP